VLWSIACFDKNRVAIAAGLLFALITLPPYPSAAQNCFVSIGDNGYIIDNNHFTSEITRTAILCGAADTDYASN